MTNLRLTLSLVIFLEILTVCIGVMQFQKTTDCNLQFINQRNLHNESVGFYDRSVEPDLSFTATIAFPTYRQVKYDSIHLIDGHNQVEDAERNQKLNIKLKKIDSNFVSILEIVEQVNSINDLRISVAEVTDKYPFNEEKEEKHKVLIPYMPNVTLKEFLDTICEADKRYTYQATNKAIIVYPQKWLSHDIMNVKIKEFVVRNATYMELVDKIVFMPPLGSNSDSCFFTMSRRIRLDKQISLNLKNITYFELFNEIASKMGGYWVSTGVTDVPAVGKQPPIRMLRFFRFEFE